MITMHRILGTWARKVNLFIASSRFARDKFIQGGIPEDRIVVKPNFIDPDIGLGPHSEEFVLYIGRLSPEKGIATLLQAWERLPQIPLRIVGDGPLRDRVLSAALINPGLSYLGRLHRDSLVAQMKEARLLIFPSESYEGFPMTIAEAFASGLPVVASNLGSTREIIGEAETGIHFSPGNPDDLAAKVRWAWEHPTEMAEMGRNARREYEEKYTAEKNYEMLMEIYGRAIENHNRNA
jgi:glycosyltransferase involved in cell wall biosynthesis